MAGEPPYFGIGSQSPLILHPHCGFLPLGFLHAVCLYPKCPPFIFISVEMFPVFQTVPNNTFFMRVFLISEQYIVSPQGSLSLFPPFFTLSLFMISWGFIISPARSKLYGRQGLHPCISCSTSHSSLKILKSICQIEFSRQSMTLFDCFVPLTLKISK